MKATVEGIGVEVTVRRFKHGGAMADLLLDEQRMHELYVALTRSLNCNTDAPGWLLELCDALDTNPPPAPRQRPAPAGVPARRPA